LRVRPCYDSATRTGNLPLPDPHWFLNPLLGDEPA
jgi:hypothetical protein